MQVRKILYKSFCDVIAIDNKRQSNMEILRIISMGLVVLVHCNYLSLGWDDFDTHTTTGFVRVFCEQACVVCVNVFVLISGWFGIKSKWGGYFSLMFQVAFFSIIIGVAYKITGRPLSLGDFIPTILGYCYWFVPSYLILYALSPILNSFIENSGKLKLQNVLFVLMVLELLYGFLSDVGRMHSGHSAISFILLYMIARYCRLYPNWFTTRSISWDLFIYVLLTIIPTLITCIRGYSGNMLNYDSPFVIMASLHLLLAFSKMQFKSRVVNWVASSSFAVYLLHQHSSVVPFFKKCMFGAWSHYNGMTYIAICICVTIGLFVVSIFLDKIRLFFYKCILAMYTSNKC